MLRIACPHSTDPQQAESTNYMYPETAVLKVAIESRVTTEPQPNNCNFQTDYYDYDLSPSKLSLR